jgi:acyl-CoA synthetase (AMP-forming)/AMP-acid ligase II
VELEHEDFTHGTLNLPLFPGDERPDAVRAVYNHVSDLQPHSLRVAAARPHTASDDKRKTPITLSGRTTERIASLSRARFNRMTKIVATGHPRPTGQELIRFTRERVGYKAPEEIVFIDEIPLNPTGKVDRTGLTRLAQEHLTAHSEAESASDVLTSKSRRDGQTTRR